jgi:serine/threonine protein kinase
MRSRPNPLYNLVNKDYHEKFDAYSPQRADFYDLVSSGLPPGWSIERRGLWFHCGSPQNYVPQQGWKIHVSATPANARDVLSRVSSVLLQRADTDFKFAADLSTLFLLNSKNWSRGGSGKFITIYPQSNAHFLDLLEQLDQVTEGLRGPYILSDHRYKNSNVLFYRYGGMRFHEKVNVKGERTPMLVAPDGREIPDRRNPYPVIPTWEIPPLPMDSAPSPAPGLRVIKCGRYQIEQVLAFSNAGGVYRALDRQTGRPVVLKEARPCVNSTLKDYDAVELLKKEFRLLTVLQDSGIAPQPVELFHEWEHWFLVEEYIPGTSLAAHCAEHNVLLRTRPQPEHYTEWYTTFREICLGLANIIDVLHQRGIVFADLSTSNLMVLPGATELKVIDFEGASQIGVDPPSAVYTPGFVSGSRLAGGTPTFEDDYYSVGAVLLASLFPLNALLHLQPDFKTRIMACIQRDARLPKAVADMILALMNQDPTRRPSPAQVTELMRVETEPAPVAPERFPIHDYEAVLKDVVSHIKQAATYSRKDRLFPSDPKLFVTNPLSLAYGAAGVGYALKKIEGGGGEVVEWILRHEISPEFYPPGLYVGISGIALCLLEMGAAREAEEVFRLTFGHPLLWQTPDIFYGIAGYGLANLHFFLKTDNQLYLDKANEAGRKLLKMSRLAPAGYCWESLDETRLGFAHGASGIALFLLYLHCATGNSEFLNAGQQALEFDLSLAVETRDGGLSWPERASVSAPLFPYWRFGSAGIGSSLLRYYAYLGTDRYRSLLTRIFIDTNRRYAVFPGRFLGLAGLGDFMLDMHEFTRDDSYRAAAAKVADAIMQFAVERHGTAFPGDMLSRLCCDYGTGSAGIALFMNRLLRRGNGDFTLDGLLQHSWVVRLQEGKPEPVAA